VDTGTRLRQLTPDHLREKMHAARTARAGTVTTQDGTTIPPASIRLGGHNFSDGEDYLSSGKSDVRRLVDSAGLTRDSRVLDIGCGVGRLATGLASEFGGLRNYTGVDVDRGRIMWCRRNLRGQGVSFIHVDLANARYNSGGVEIDASFRLPLPDRSIDVIYLYSVFSHMETPDVTVYLHEFARLLRDDGHVFLTAFLEDGVPDMEINPPDYGTFPGEWDGALHCVRYDSSFFAAIVRGAGLEIERFEHASDTDGQSALVLSRAARGE
jgi:SAM-dependent methyltransferase